MFYYDDEDCDGCGRFDCECDEEREPDDYDRCHWCDRFYCDCSGWLGWYDELPSALWRRRHAIERERKARRAAALAACAPRLRRAILAARRRRLPAPAVPHPASCSCNDCVPF